MSSNETPSLPSDDSLDKTVDCKETGAADRPASNWEQATFDMARSQSVGDATAVTSTDSSAPSSREFGEYELLGEIARGGMGMVYRARQRKLNRTVALKMILAGNLASSVEIQRFYTEAEAAARLDHSGIVPIYEIGEKAGQHFYSMAFIEGQSLQERLKEGPLPADEAADLLCSIADAVHYAHTKGIVHRDLKPHNILLDREGRPKITDFGLAKRMDSGDGLTNTGDVLGTPSYMAPEQAQAKHDAIGPHTDVYALGAILYATLTGRPPFQAASLVDVLQQVIRKEPVAPTLLNPATPLDLETVCLKCLEKDPSRRYRDCASLADDLRRWREGKPISARRAGKIERGVKWTRRNPLVACLGTAFVLSLVVGAIVSLAFGFMAQQKAKQERTARQFADQETKRANQALADLTVEQREVEKQKNEVQKQLDRSLTVAYSYELREAQRELNDGHVAAAKAILDRCDPKFSLWEHALLERETQRLVREYPGHTANVLALALNADDTRLASVASDGVAKVWDTERGKMLLSFSVRGTTHYSIAFTPDDKRLITTGGMGLNVWDAGTGEEALPLDRCPTLAWASAISRDGKQVAGGFQGKFFLWNLETGEKALEQDFDSQRLIDSLDFSPDGLRLLMLMRSTTDKPLELAVWDVTEKAWLFQLPLAEGAVIRDPCFSDDGQRIVYHTDVADEWVICDAATGRELIVATADAGGLRYDGRLVASHEQRRQLLWFDRKANDLRVADAGQSGRSVILPCGGAQDALLARDGQRLFAAQGQQVVEWGAHVGIKPRVFTADWTTSIAFSPDRRRLAAAGDGKIRIWDLIAGQEERVITEAENAPRSSESIAYSPDGRFIVTTGVDATARVWDVVTGETKLQFECGGGRAIYTPDGASIVVSGGGQGPTFYDAQSGKQQRQLEAGGGIDLALSRDGRLAASADRENSVLVWDVSTGQITHTLKGHTFFIYAMQFSPDGKRLVSGGADQTARVWDLANGVELFTLRGHTMSVQSLDVSPDGQRIVSGAGHYVRESPDLPGEVIVWDMNTGMKLLALPDPGWWIRGVSFSPDGTKIAAGCQGRRVSVWDTVSGSASRILRGHETQVLSVAVSPDDRRIASGSIDGEIRVWDFSTGKLVQTWNAHAGGIAKIAYSPDGRFIVSAASDNKLHFWNAASFEIVRTLKPQGRPGSQEEIAFDFDREGGRLATSNSEFSPWQVWNGDGSKLLFANKEPEYGGVALALQGDGKQLVTVGQRGIRLWDIEANKRGQYFVDERQVFGLLRTVAMSPDGEIIAVAGTDAVVWVWNARNGALLHKLKGHNGEIRALTFTRDGQRLASASRDLTIKIWDIVKGSEFLALRGHTDGVRAIAFKRDGKQVVSAGLDRTVRIWQLE